MIVRRALPRPLLLVLALLPALLLAGCGAPAAAPPPRSADCPPRPEARPVQLRHALVARLLAREGCDVVEDVAGEDGAATVTFTGPGRFTVVSGGGAQAEGIGWAELAAWARLAAR